MKQKKLLCIDVDGTIFLKSLHNYLCARLIKASKFGISIDIGLILEYTDDFLNNSDLSWRNKNKLIILIKKAWLADYEVALVSFNDFPVAIKYAMSKILGEDVEKLYINSYLPEVLKQSYTTYPLCDKQEHIKTIMTQVGVLNPNNVLLIEDTKHNVDMAIKAEMNAILIVKEDREFAAAFEALGTLNIESDLFTGPLTEPDISVEDNVVIDEGYGSEDEHMPCGVPTLGDS